MSYLLINHIKVQNANAIAGFTWGFPAITHFLGFSHQLSRKLSETNFSDISLSGCAVIAHQHQVHTYKPSNSTFGFIQSRSQPYLKCVNYKDGKNSPPPVVEEGKMNMAVSLLIRYHGILGNRSDGFRKEIEKIIFLQRLAGGTILSIGSVEVCDLTDQCKVKSIKRKLLPGFILLDRSAYLKEHYEQLVSEKYNAELLDAWLDFSALKKSARPRSDKIEYHIDQELKNSPEDRVINELSDAWARHKAVPYQENGIPNKMITYFNKLESISENKILLDQWKSYCKPSIDTDADWEYIENPQCGYLIPIMTGYKAISKVYENKEVQQTRDNETPVCFVESVHSVGEWLSVHKLNCENQPKIEDCLWDYHNEDNWYLCKQKENIFLAGEEEHIETGDSY